MPNAPDASPRPRVLITAGPTAEDIDPVRFITNRSTGRMGMETAAAVLRAGGAPRVILGPVAIEPPAGVEVVRVRSAEDMLGAVTANLAWADSLVMTAAVADYTPAEPLDVKMKKRDGDLVLRLKRTPDILKTIRDLPERRGRFVVGFSLDVGMNLAEGRRKMAEKGLDCIVVNTTESFGSGEAVAWMLSPEGETEAGRLAKRDLADAVVSRIMAYWRTKEISR